MPSLHNLEHTFSFILRKLARLHHFAQLYLGNSIFLFKFLCMPIFFNRLMHYLNLLFKLLLYSFIYFSAPNVSALLFLVTSTKLSFSTFNSLVLFSCVWLFSSMSLLHSNFLACNTYSFLLSLLYCILLLMDLIIATFY